MKGSERQNPDFLLLKGYVPVHKIQLSLQPVYRPSDLYPSVQDSADREGRIQSAHRRGARLRQICCQLPAGSGQLFSVTYLQQERPLTTPNSFN